MKIHHLIELLEPLDHDLEVYYRTAAPMDGNEAKAIAQRILALPPNQHLGAIRQALLNAHVPTMLDVAEVVPAGDHIIIS